MYGDAISRDMNSLLYSSTFKHPSDGEFAKIKELISSDPYPRYDNHNQYNRNQNQNQQQPDGDFENESSLMRNRSAPNSFFLNLLNDNGCQEFLDPVTASSPEERHEQQQKVSESDSRDVLQYSLSSTAIKQESKESEIQKLDLRPPATYGGDSRHAPTLPPINNISNTDNTQNHRNLESWSSFRVTNSTSSNLIRQSSSPAEFLSSSTVGNGFASTRVLGKVGSSNTLNNHITFSSLPSSSRFLPQISENENETDDTSFNSLKRSRDGDFLQFQQDSVPCKIRAKRGFATHPRSIAERERRTRISERMKKLQELFPNMDKQMNIADMLDMALDYVKDLQNEVQALNDARSRCVCSSKQLQSGSTK